MLRKLATEFYQNNGKKLRNQTQHGIERETLRITSKGTLAKTPHPSALGSKLLNPFISTDFCEAQLELITSHHGDVLNTLKELESLHIFALQNIDSEYIWPASFPCILPKNKQEIAIADFGKTQKANNKNIYRQGLALRYGHAMQALSGVHYNFSFSDDFFSSFANFLQIQGSASEVKSDIYLHMVRNYMRYGWFCTYLFGSSPVVDKSFFPKIPKGFSSFDRDTYIVPDATSIRSSTLGYYSKDQAKMHISCNNLIDYCKDLKKAITTVHPRFKKIPIYDGEKFLQLNANLLQQEAEFYSRIRPKPKFSPNLRTLDSLAEQGISYLEVRTIDVNPFSNIGVDLEQLNFVELMLHYCLIKESPSLSANEQQRLNANQNLVSLYGRKKNLKLDAAKNKKILLRDYAKQILEELQVVATTLSKNSGRNEFLSVFEKAVKATENEDLTLSGQFLHELTTNKKSFRQYCIEKAKAQKLDLAPKSAPSHFAEIAKKSCEDLEITEHREDALLPGYEDLEISTQMIIREAQKRNLKIEILDRKDNFIRISSGKKSEMLKQASNTRLDNLLSYFVMENKHVSKLILHEKNIRVPQGDMFTNKEHALESFTRFSSHKVVVKPNFTNFGLGVNFVEAYDQEGYIRAIENAFSFGTEILIEDFIPGSEYRFLVLAGKVVAVCERIPANIKGDGKSTIAELVREKNANPKFYKSKYPIIIQDEELSNLKAQHLTPSSIIAAERTVFLRKNSNVSNGGDPIDRTDYVHAGYKKIAQKAANAVNAVFCGLDMIIAEARTSPTANNHAILEVNFNPALHLHRYPVFGKKYYVEKIVLDMLGF